jgi:hypothetical protein
MKKYVWLAVVLIIIIAAAVFFNLPQRIGLAKSPAEKLLEQRLDETAASQIMTGMRQAGIDTQGLEVYVIPYKDSDESLAVAVLDASKGFDIRDFAREDITEYLTTMAELDENGDYNIRRVAVDYKGETGESLLTMTAPTDTVTDYSEGKIDREEFLDELEGQVNFVEVAKIFSGELQ